MIEPNAQNDNCLYSFPKMFQLIILILTVDCVSTFNHDPRDLNLRDSVNITAVIYIGILQKLTHGKMKLRFHSKICTKSYYAKEIFWPVQYVSLYYELSQTSLLFLNTEKKSRKWNVFICEKSFGGSTTTNISPFLLHYFPPDICFHLYNTHTHNLISHAFLKNYCMPLRQLANKNPHTNTI